MRLSFAIFIVTFVTLCTSNAQAEIYTCKDANGKTVYTDSPGACINAEEVEVDELPTLVPTKPLATRPSTTSSANKEEDKNPYNELTITSPSNDATIRNNQGNLTINFRVTPALQTRKGHKFVVTFDGAEVYSGTSTITALKNVDRGTHSISVNVVDANGSTKISATPVKVTLQRFSALQNADSDNGNGDPDSNSNNQSFPSNTKLPTRPPPPATAN